MSEFALGNARIVLGDEVVEGSVLVRDGLIVAIERGPAQHAEDLGGDYLIPGLVELHTDHFENHYRPRPGVTWNAIAALQSHDAQVAGAGITTVFDAVRIGSDPEVGDITDDVRAMVEAVAAADADDRLRADHHIHLRCELPTPDAAQHFEEHCSNPIVGLASLMDHTPGQRQYTTLEHYTAYYQKKCGSPMPRWRGSSPTGRPSTTSMPTPTAPRSSRVVARSASPSPAMTTPPWRMSMRRCATG